MKTTIYLMSALAGAALLTACSADTTDPDFDGQGSEVLVRATIGSATTRTSPEASNNMVFSNGDKMSLNDGKNTGVYTYDSGTDKWSPAAGEFLKWEKSGTIEAWSPANGTNQYDKGVIMQDQSTSDNLAASDYMTGSYTYSSIPADRTLTLMMERETALVVIDKDFEYGDEFDGTTPTVTDVCVMSSLYVPNDDDLKAISPYTDADGYRYAIVSPTLGSPVTTFIQLTVTAGSTTKTLTIKGIPELVAGKRYSFKLHVGKEAALVGSVKVTEWEDGSSITDKAVYKCTINGNTITLTTPGVLADNPDLIKQTIGSGNSLTVKGTINDDDIAAINQCIKDGDEMIDLDLSGTTITTIPKDAFSGNENLAKVTLPKTLKTIGDNAFFHCNAASFPNFEEVAPSLETIGTRAFRETGLNGSITLSALKSVGHAAFSGTSISSITFPPAITEVPTMLLAEIKGECSIVFKGNLTYIGSYAFDGKLTSVDLTACNAVPTCDESAFAYLITATQIFVKSSLLNDFKNAEVWKDIASQLVGK